MPIIELTSQEKWNPKIIDHEITDYEDWSNSVQHLKKKRQNDPFDARGEYKYQEDPHTVDDPEDDDCSYEESDNSDGEDDPQDEIYFVDALEEQDASEENLNQENTIGLQEAFHILSNLNQVYIDKDIGYTPEFLCAHEAESDDKESRHVQPIGYRQNKDDWKRYRRHFLNAPDERIKKTFDTTTQYARNVMDGIRVEKTIKSPFPAYNVTRRNEPVATDTVYAEEPAFYSGGQKAAQIFIGRKSLFIDVYGMGSTSEFINTLLENIRKRGAPDLLITDSAKVETSERVLDVLRA